MHLERRARGDGIDGGETKFLEKKSTIKRVWYGGMRRLEDSTPNVVWQHKTPIEKSHPNSKKELSAFRFYDD